MEWEQADEANQHHLRLPREPLPESVVEVTDAANSAPPAGHPRRVVQIRHVHDWRPASIFASAEDLGGGRPCTPKMSGVEVKPWVCAEYMLVSMSFPNGEPEGALRLDPGTLLSFPASKDKAAFAVLEWKKPSFFARSIAEVGVDDVRRAAALSGMFNQAHSPWRFSTMDGATYCTSYHFHKLVHLRMRRSTARKRYNNCEKCSALIKPGIGHWTTSEPPRPTFCDSCVRGAK